MKIINLVIYFDDPQPMGYPFGSPEYYRAYMELCQSCRKYRIAPYIARGKSYLKNMVFSGGWQFSRNRLITVNRKIKADVIYKKGFKLKLKKQDKVINPQGLEDICRNKMTTYRLFKKYLPKSYHINKDNYQRILKKIPSRRVVLKPITGQEGIGIVIVDKNKFSLKIISQSNDRYLAQQFIETHSGIPHLIAGRHDLRIVCFNGTKLLAYVRQPKKGGYLANIAQGGKLTVIKNEQIPESALAIFKAVDIKLSQFLPRIYSLDLGYERNKPYIFELNSQPGLPSSAREKFHHYHSRFHQYLLETIINTSK